MFRWMVFFLLVIVGMVVGVAYLLGIPLNFFNQPSYTY
jgi:hypothetical protein